MRTFYLAFVKDDYGSFTSTIVFYVKPKKKPVMAEDPLSSMFDTPSNFTLFDNNTTSTINLVFHCDQESVGSIFNASIPLCIHRDNNPRTGITVGFPGLTIQ
jgi:hypothetical protein